MMKRSLSRLALIVLAPVFLTLAACSSTETVKAPSPSYIQLAPVAPPEPLFEVRQQPVDPMIEMWRPGYWSHDGQKFKWVSGRLMPKPYPTATWNGDRWFKFTYGWAFIPGHWM
jgi:hypothetical protein